jgi:hypothetical protein
MRFSIVVIVCSSDRLEIRVILLAKSIEPDLDYQGNYEDKWKIFHLL